MRPIRYVPHPDEALLVDLEYEGKFNEVVLYINDEVSEPFVTQVNDRMTVEDSYLVLHNEFVRKPRRE